MLVEVAYWLVEVEIGPSCPEPPDQLVCLNMLLAVLAKY